MAFVDLPTGVQAVGHKGHRSSHLMRAPDVKRSTRHSHTNRFMFPQVSVNGRTECTCDGATVNTNEYILCVDSMVSRTGLKRGAHAACTGLPGSKAQAQLHTRAHTCTHVHTRAEDESTSTVG